mmetsp:Transcript_2302/g.5312  ORF Transcript_2302/g.5312 Transcript_2302/m.5312 type:complete len:81 (-) Transcript_2302:1071-1313(-)
MIFLVIQYKDKYEALLKEYDQLKDAYAESQAKAQQLEELSSTLERNLCCLYDTAKLEIERKDQIIKDTREQLADARHKAN